ncbi:MAG: hypothetical protein EZS28_032293 [Streblomastix strix]|uniref:Uncharacterized protein n=1 Tax=Streblomastix strix TaxID=222440 RepID=A0A5J4UQ41_9EUKA|nr:MAG: hypothetical protein EZS28_032293 [Streblomastix strix]
MAKTNPVIDNRYSISSQQQQFGVPYKAQSVIMTNKKKKKKLKRRMQDEDEGSLALSITESKVTGQQKKRDQLSKDVQVIKPYHDEDELTDCNYYIYENDQGDKDDYGQLAFE